MRSPEKLAADERLLTKGDLRARWRISHATLWRRQKEPDFPTAIVIGRFERFRLADVLAYEAARTRAA